MYVTCPARMSPLALPADIPTHNVDAENDSYESRDKVKNFGTTTTTSVLVMMPSTRPTAAKDSPENYGGESSRDDKHEVVSGFSRKLFRLRLVEGRIAVRVPAYEPSIVVSEGLENRDAHTAPPLHPLVYLGSRKKHGESSFDRIGETGEGYVRLYGALFTVESALCSWWTEIRVNGRRIETEAENLVGDTPAHSAGR
ncbi:hypothetical protein FB451DRAFT_1177624 [Mycena latifolia]|nr:hypothetical protein FB451DRAFT_1177624 [Mycena latifolia]